MYEKVEILFHALLNLAVEIGMCLYSGTQGTQIFRQARSRVAGTVT